MSWEEFFLAYAAPRRLSPATLRGYRRDLNLFLAFWHSERIDGPRDVQSRHLREFYQAQKLAPTVSAATAGARLRSLLILLRWAVRQNILLVDPGHGMKIPKPARPIPRVLTQNECERLLEAPNSARAFIRLRDRALLELFYGTGMRSGEALALNIEDLDMTDSSLRILGGKGKNRRVPFGDSVANALSAYLAWLLPRYSLSGETALFLSLSGERMAYRNLSGQLWRYGEALGIPGVTAHALRRAVATHLLENGANIAEIKALLGHEDIDSTVTYTRVFPVELLRTHSKTHPRARRKPHDA